MELGSCYSTFLSPYSSHIFIFLLITPRPVCVCVCLSQCRDLIRWIPSWWNAREGRSAHAPSRRIRRRNSRKRFLVFSFQNNPRNSLRVVFHLTRFANNFPPFFLFSFVRHFSPIVLLPGFHSITKIRAIFSLFFLWTIFHRSFLGSAVLGWKCSSEVSRERERRPSLRHVWHFSRCRDFPCDSSGI